MYQWCKIVFNVFSQYEFVQQWQSSWISDPFLRNHSVHVHEQFRFNQDCRNNWMLIYFSQRSLLKCPRNNSAFHHTTFEIFEMKQFSQSNRIIANYDLPLPCNVSYWITNIFSMKLTFLQSLVPIDPLDWLKRFIYR